MIFSAKYEVCVNLQVRCWEVQQNGQTIPKAQQTHTGPVMDVAWSDVRTFLRILMSCMIKVVCLFDL